MRGGGKTDLELTKIRRELGDYTDPRSYVRPDGAEFLFGEDLTRRRRECWEKYKRRCACCAKYVTFDQFEMHHRKTRGRGGDDSLGNLQVLCADCHRGPNGKHA